MTGAAGNGDDHPLLIGGETALPHPEARTEDLDRNGGTAHQSFDAQLAVAIGLVDPIVEVEDCLGRPLADLVFDHQQNVSAGDELESDRFGLKTFAELNCDLRTRATLGTSANPNSARKKAAERESSFRRAGAALAVAEAVELFDLAEDVNLCPGNRFALFVQHEAADPETFGEESSETGSEKSRKLVTAGAIPGATTTPT